MVLHSRKLLKKAGRNYHQILRSSFCGANCLDIPGLWAPSDDDYSEGDHKSDGDSKDHITAVACDADRKRIETIHLYTPAKKCTAYTRWTVRHTRDQTIVSPPKHCTLILHGPILWSVHRSLLLLP